VLVLSGPDLGPPPTGDESPSGQSAFDPTAAAFAVLAFEQQATDDASTSRKRTTRLA
jgi:hypothetical protein